MTTATRRDFRRNGRLRKAADADQLRQRLSAMMPWRVGDTCRTPDRTAITTVARVEGDRITLATGEELHRSKMRSV